MQIIYKADNITEAHIIKGLLESHGIDAYVNGYYLQGGIGELASFDFSNVAVESHDVAKATKILTEQGHIPHSPETESDNEQASTNSVSVMFIAVLLMVLLFFFLM